MATPPSASSAPGREYWRRSRRRSDSALPDSRYPIPHIPVFPSSLDPNVANNPTAPPIDIPSSSRVLFGDPPTLNTTAIPPPATNPTTPPRRRSTETIPLPHLLDTTPPATLTSVADNGGASRGTWAGPRPATPPPPTPAPGRPDRPDPADDPNPDSPPPLETYGPPLPQEVQAPAGGGVGVDEEVQGNPDGTPPPSITVGSSDATENTAKGKEAVLEVSMRYDIIERPRSLWLCFYYGLQHLSVVVGPLLVLPLVLVPAMGGAPGDVAAVVSTTLLMSGLSTLVHALMGTRLPLLQGPSLALLGPTLAIMAFPRLSSQEPAERFRATMRELQGAMITGSGFQILAGYTGAIHYLLPFITPSVSAVTTMGVALTAATVAFPLLASCIEVGLPHLLLMLLFSPVLGRLSTKKFMVSNFFLVAAVPLGVALAWIWALILTAGGAYNYGSCSKRGWRRQPPTELCQQPRYTMMHCRTDASTAISDARWFQMPYPFQWGAPTFSAEGMLLAIAGYMLAVVESVGSYYHVSRLVAPKRPSNGVVGRGIGAEGLASLACGAMGVPCGSATLVGNSAALTATRMGHRVGVECAAVFLCLLSVCGKLGGLIAAMPRAMVGAVLCVAGAGSMAAGFGGLAYAAPWSSRHQAVLGLVLFLSTSISNFVAQYTQKAGQGPVHGASWEVEYVCNTLLAFIPFLACFLAILMDGITPLRKAEGGRFKWDTSEDGLGHALVPREYCLPMWGEPIVLRQQATLLQWTSTMVERSHLPSIGWAGRRRQP